MKSPHRRLHRVIWLILPPLLLAAIFHFSAPHTQLSPPGDAPHAPASKPAFAPRP